jgi:hypothetical protein
MSTTAPLPQLARTSPSLTPQDESRFRTYALDRVAHTGSMNPADKNSRYESYEGHGLSVCLPTDAERWEDIAELCGEPWTLSKPSGCFLDRHSLTAAQRNAVEEWAIKRGYATRLLMWAAIVEHEYEDGSVEKEIIYEHTREDVLAEAACRGPVAGAVHTEMVIRGTPALAERLGMRDVQSCFDLLVVCYVEDELPDLDGVWWEDSYAYLSAPRGVILPGKLAGWSVMLSTDGADPDDADELCAGEWR